MIKQISRRLKDDIDYRLDITTILTLGVAYVALFHFGIATLKDVFLYPAAISPTLPALFKQWGLVAE